MIPVEIVSIISLLYIGLLFVVAYIAEKKRAAQRLYLFPFPGSTLHLL